MSSVELAVERVKRLDERQADALLEWLELRENRGALRRRLDEEIETGLAQLRRGEKIPGKQVHAEIQERSLSRLTTAQHCSEPILLEMVALGKGLLDAFLVHDSERSAVSERKEEGAGEDARHRFAVPQR